jgi:hypothetical protein
MRIAGYSHIKVHPHACGAKSGNQDIGRTKGKIHLALDAHGMPIRVFITDGTTADCTQASKQGINAEYVLADKGDDSDEIIQKGEKTRNDSCYTIKEKMESPKRIRKRFIQAETFS